MCIVYLNWAAPARVPAKIQQVQAQVMGAVCNTDSAGNVGLLLMPVFAHKKGYVFKAEQAAQSRLANANLNLDKSMALYFQDKGDERDQRLRNSVCEIVAVTISCSLENSSFNSSSEEPTVF